MPVRRRPNRLGMLLGATLALALAGLPALAGLVAVDGAGALAGCVGSGGSGPPALLAGAGGVTVGATEYGGPGDPSSGTVGSSGVNLLKQPDSYAELGGLTFATADAMGGLPYGTPLQITWDGRSVIAYKRDIGLGGGPVDGHPRVIDLWWELAERLRIPYEHGLWSGTVRIRRPPATGAAALLGAVLSPSPLSETGATDAVGATASATSGCGLAQAAGAVLPVVDGPRAQILPDGSAAAPRDAPAAVRGIIAAGNQIVGRPYLYGGGHGLPLNQLAPAYDCSSSVAHLLYGGGLLPASADMTSGELESWGRPGPGRWVTIYASPEHVFMYVAGVRWDTHNAAGAGDGATGIGWHPLVRDSAGFVVRHPEGL